MSCGGDDSDVATTAEPSGPAGTAATSGPSTAADQSATTLDDGTSPATTSSGDSTMAAAEQSFAGTLAEATVGGDAVTYDATQAPVDATLEVMVEPGDGDTTFTLTVSGMQPDRGYAVHAHVNPCGATGDAAGPHFQYEPDPAATPEAPSIDPVYANSDNEVWLDLATDADGAGTATATVPFMFIDTAPQSIVVHADEMTMTQDGMAGMAGDRIACLDASIT